MEYEELIRARYSVRAYKPDPIEDEKLAQVLEAARLAPTAANRQPFQLVVIHTKGQRTRAAAHLPARMVQPGTRSSFAPAAYLGSAGCEMICDAIWTLMWRS